MNNTDEILIQLYFPNFNSPSSSRFESLFLILDKIDGKKKKNISYIIFKKKKKKKKKKYILYNISRTYNK